MKSFEYCKPSSLSEAAKLLANGDARALAGGHTLLPAMKQRLDAPSMLVDLSGVSELSGEKIREEKGALVIGALARHAEVAACGIVQKAIPALAKLAGGIGDAQVRNRGTLGGSLANNDPAADYPAAALALGATVRTNKREIGADDFFTGLFSTVLGRGGDNCVGGVSDSGAGGLRQVSAAGVALRVDRGVCGENEVGGSGCGDGRGRGRRFSRERAGISAGEGFFRRRRWTGLKCRRRG